MPEQLTHHRPTRLAWHTRFQLGAPILTLIILTSSIALYSNALACEADSVIGVFEAEIERHEVVYLKYEKESHSLLFGDRPTEEGKIWLGPPKQYRIETPGQTVVRGIDTLWTYSEATNQVTLRIGSLDSLDFGAFGFFGSLRSDYFPVDCQSIKSDGKPAWKIRLAAKTETAAIQRLTLWIDQAMKLVTAAEYVDYNEETTHLRFSGFRVKGMKAEKVFKFDSPSDAELIVLPPLSSSRRSNTGN